MLILRWLRRIVHALQLAAFFAWQLVIANFKVAADVVRPHTAIRPAVVAVPLHWFRERMRGYNQAAALAGAFAAKAGMPVLEGVLRRRRATRTQTELGRRERGENVRGAFEVRRPEAVKGKAILLVDDVCTTGATLEACVPVSTSGGRL